MKRSRHYETLNSQVSDVIAELGATSDQLMRSHLLERWADLTDQQAALHPAVFGPDVVFTAYGAVDLARALADAAGLLRLVAGTELVGGMSTWVWAWDLRPGSRFWQHGWAIATDVEVVKTGLKVFYGGTRAIFELEELVRVDGPDRFPPVEQAVDAGASFAEAMEWHWLCNAASHDHRAAMLLQVSGLAAGRVGDAAASVLQRVADTEDRLAGSGAC